MSSDVNGIEVRHLRYFLAVAEEASFTRASDRLYVGQPALSVAVRQLEAAVGVTLLERSGRGVRLTVAGEAFRRSAEQTLAGLERGVVRARDAGKDNLPVRLAMPYEGNDTGRMILRQLREQHPGVTIERLYGGSRFAHGALVSGEADAVVGGAFRLPSGITSELVRRERLVAVLPSGHRLASASAVTLADLADDALYLPADEKAPTWTGFVRELFRLTGLEPEVVGGDGGGPTVFTDWVAERRCVAIAVRSDELGHGVVARPISDGHAVYPWSLLWLAADPGPAVAAVLGAARLARERRGWLSPQRVH